MDVFINKALGITFYEGFEKELLSHIQTLKDFVKSEKVSVDFLRTENGYRFLISADFIDGKKNYEKEIGSLDESFLFLASLAAQYLEKKERLLNQTNVQSSEIQNQPPSQLFSDVISDRNQEKRYQVIEKPNIWFSFLKINDITNSLYFLIIFLFFVYLELKHDKEILLIPGLKYLKQYGFHWGLNSIIIVLFLLCVFLTVMNILLRIIKFRNQKSKKVFKLPFLIGILFFILMGLFYMAIADGTFFINFDNKIDRVFLPILLFGLPGLSFTIGAVVPRFICDKKRKIIKQSPPLQLSEKVEFETLKIDYNEHELKTINLSPKMERTFNGLKIISKIIVGLNLSFGLLLGIFLFQRTLIESNMVNTKYLNAFELLDVLAYSKYKLLFSIILVLTMFVLLIFSIKNIWVLIKGSADETQNFRFSLLIFICILCLNITLKRLSLMANETLIFQYSLNYSLQIWLAACLVIFNFSNRFTNKSYFLYIIQQVSHFKNRKKILKNLRLNKS